MLGCELSQHDGSQLFKTSDRVRARVVAKDLRSKSSARELGFSSPTPSCEILHIVLSIASEKGWRMRSFRRQSCIYA